MAARGRYGKLTNETYHAPNTSLAWLFYTVNDGAGWEDFRTGVVQLRW